MRFVWDEPKRLANLKKHGLDFADAEKAFAGPMVLIEDSREDYDEQRMIGIGLLDCLAYQGRPPGFAGEAVEV